MLPRRKDESHRKSAKEDIQIPFVVQSLVDNREKYRINKQFIQSDGLRKEINDLGYDVEDTPDGPKIWKKI